MQVTNRRAIRIVGLLLLTVHSLIGAEPAAPENKIRYLSPDAFVHIPIEVRNELKRAGCVIPQAGAAGPHNLIRGEFLRKGRQDWAALCSWKSKSSIVILSDDKTKCAQQAAADDAAFLQQIDEHRQQYSRQISTQSASDIARRMDRSEGARLPMQLDHDGIEDAFIGKASTIYYCHQGEWREFDGAD